MFSKATVATRLFIGFGFVLLILVAVTVIAILKVKAIDSALSENGERHAPIQRAAINFRGSVHDRAIAIRDLALASTADEREQEVERIDRLAAFYADAAGQLGRLAAEPSAPAELRQKYEVIQAAERQALEVTQQLVEAQPGSQAARDLLWSRARPLYVQWLASINELINLEESHIRIQDDVAKVQARGFVSAMLTALMLAILASSIAAWRVVRTLSSQLGAEPAALVDC